MKLIVFACEPTVNIILPEVIIITRTEDLVTQKRKIVKIFFAEISSRDGKKTERKTHTDAALRF